ncbi:MAG: adenylosuccinate lyase [Epsilonproteobacteria bacterium]|nr:adenylosuccinate lyase [Campylobacterota bacterium]
MINRYTLAKMGKIWGRKNRYDAWLKVELAALQAQAEFGMISKNDYEKIRRKARFDIDRIDEIEKETRHDVIAFLSSVRENLSDEGRLVHYGMTSSDTIDTANAIILLQAAEIIDSDIRMLMDSLKNQAYRYKLLPMVGRTHGIHAEPISLGLVFALWYADMNRNLSRIERIKNVVAVGKISGAVGTYAHLAPQVEKRACEILKLKPASISNQIIQRDRYADYLCTLAIIASTIEKIATQIRHFSRTEVSEAEEFFHKGQKGSSAMPHKRNPVLSENLCGLSRIVKANAMVGLDNVALWHERDISHSSAERIVLPDSSTLIDFMLNRLNDITTNIMINKAGIEKNLNLTNGLIYSQSVLLRLVDKGVDREKAYRWVQSDAMNSRYNFKEAVMKNKNIAEYLSGKELASVFDPQSQLIYVDYIFNNVFENREE